MLWRRSLATPRQSRKPPLGLGVKAPLRRFAALTPASLRLESQCGSRRLPSLDQQKRLSQCGSRRLPSLDRQKRLSPSETRSR
jgi:hypothetical protein